MFIRPVWPASAQRAVIELKLLYGRQEVMFVAGIEQTYAYTDANWRIRSMCVFADLIPVVLEMVEDNQSVYSPDLLESVETARYLKPYN